jgi:hypothetical protein
MEREITAKARFSSSVTPARDPQCFSPAAQQMSRVGGRSARLLRIDGQNHLNAGSGCDA